MQTPFTCIGFLIAAMALAPDVLAQQFTATKGVTSAGVRREGFSSQGYTRQGVNSRKLSSRGPTATDPFAQSHPVITVYGEAQGKPVLAPEVRNTTVVQAQYIRPSLGNNGKAFEATGSQNVRLPLATKKHVYWVPNQQSLIVND